MIRILLLSGFALTAAEWPAFRGAQRDGMYEPPVRTEWPSSGLPQAWRISIGDGYAGLSAAAGKVFTLEQRGKQEVATAYELASGRSLWATPWPGEFRSFLGGNGPRSTPTYADGKVYVVGALGQFHCLDAETGKMLWSKDLLREAGIDNIRWGMAWSPLVYADTVIALAGGRGASVIAYHKDTGAVQWKALDDEQAYTSPVLVTLSGTRQLLVVSQTRVVGLRPGDGSLLWQHPWKTQYGVNAAQPLIVDGNRVVLSAGYGHGAALIEVKDGTARTVWENKNLKNKFNSSVLWKGYIYGLDEGILTCLNVETGQRLWKSGRYGYGQVLLGSGHLIITTEQGEVALVEASPEAWREKGRFSAVPGKTWNMPALAAGLLLVRNEKEMAAFRIAP